MFPETHPQGSEYENQGVPVVETELRFRYQVTKETVNPQWICELDSWWTQCYLLQHHAKHSASEKNSKKKNLWKEWNHKFGTYLPRVTTQKILGSHAEKN